jgi:hypothetical protein
VNEKRWLVLGVVTESYVEQFWGDHFNFKDLEKKETA